MVPRIMAKWVHKVRSYHNGIRYSSNVYPGTSGDFNNVNNVTDRENKSIEEWLDWQCEGGWELFKFHPQGWCVFRKRV